MKKIKRRSNVFDGVMFNAHKGVKSKKYKNISEALKKEFKVAKKLYGNR